MFVIVKHYLLHVTIHQLLKKLLAKEAVAGSLYADCWESMSTKGRGRRLVPYRSRKLCKYLATKYGAASDQSVQILHSTERCLCLAVHNHFTAFSSNVAKNVVNT